MRARMATVKIIYLARKAMEANKASERLTKEIDYESLYSIWRKADKLYMNDVFHATLSQKELHLLLEYI